MATVQQWMRRTFGELYTVHSKSQLKKWDAEINRQLSSNLGEERLLKLKFLMVDGATVNHVARVNCKGFLKSIYDRIDPVGEEDLGNIQRGITQKYRVSLLSCIGHMLNNVCKTAFQPYSRNLVKAKMLLWPHTFAKCWSIYTKFPKAQEHHKDYDHPFCTTRKD